MYIQLPCIFLEWFDIGRSPHDLRLHDMIVQQKLDVIDIAQHATLTVPVSQNKSNFFVQIKKKRNNLFKDLWKVPVTIDGHGDGCPLIFHTHQRVLQGHFLGGRVAYHFDFLQMFVQLKRQQLLQ